MEPNHKELLIGLIGSTYGELKRLDDSIIGSSSTLGRRSDQAKQEMMKVVNDIPSKPDVPILQAIQQFPQTPQGIPTSPSIVPDMPGALNLPPGINTNLTYVQKEDSNQLQLDLSRVAKYDDVITEIDRLDRKLNRIEDKVDQIIKNLDIIKKKARGLNDS